MHNGQKLSASWQSAKADADAAMAQYDAKLKLLRTTDDYTKTVRKVMKGFRGGLRPTLQKVEVARTQRELHQQAQAAIAIIDAYVKKLGSVPKDRRDSDAKKQNPQEIHTAMEKCLLAIKRLLRDVGEKPLATPENFLNTSLNYHKVWTSVLKLTLVDVRKEAVNDPERAKAINLLVRSYGTELAKLLKAIEAQSHPYKRVKLNFQAVKVIEKHQETAKTLRRHPLFKEYDIGSPGKLELIIATLATMHRGLISARRKEAA